MSVDKAPICDICKQPKTELVERTEQSHEAIWVCSKQVGKAKMPCDGYVFKIASRRE